MTTATAIKVSVESTNPIKWVDRFDNGTGCMEWGQVHVLRSNAENEAKKLKHMCSDVIPVRWSDKAQSYQGVKTLEIVIDSGVQYNDTILIKDNDHRLTVEVASDQTEEETVILFIKTVFIVLENENLYLRENISQVRKGSWVFSELKNWEVKNPEYGWKQWGVDYN